MSNSLEGEIRSYLHGVPHITEKKMFGGLCFLYKGKMTVGINKDKLVARIVPEKMEECEALAHTSPMTFTGKPMKEFLFVEGDAIQSQEELSKWIEMGIEHAKYKLGE